MNITAAILTFILLGVNIYWEIVRDRFVKNIFKEHHELWLNLGSPKGIVGWLFILDDWQVGKYIFFEKYKSLKSKDLLSDCIRLHRLLNIVIMVDIIVIILFYTIV